MFGFKRRSGVQSPSAAIRRALEADGLPPAVDAASVGVVESRGTYAGRTVTYIRVFDPARAAERAVDVHAFGDLEVHPDLVLRGSYRERRHGRDQLAGAIAGRRDAGAGAGGPHQAR